MVERYRADMVAKGFYNECGLNLNETFSPVVKVTTIHTILSIIISNGCNVSQLDVNNAFLHDFLNENLFMQQPLGFQYPTNPLTYVNFIVHSMVSNNRHVPSFIISLNF